MNYNETLDYINSLGKFHLPKGLSRMKEVCEKLKNPQNDFKSIHIAGTNGKGSTALKDSKFPGVWWLRNCRLSPRSIRKIS